MARDSLTGVASSYRRLAADYDRRWSRYIAATTRETLRRLDPRPGDRVLDVGCGTGALLAALGRASPAATSTGIDLVLAMLVVARRRLGAGARLVVADAERLPLRDSAVDLVVSSNSCHFWPHPERALAEIARLLRPGGRLVLTDWCDDFLACRLCDLLLRRLSRAHHRAYGSAELERLLVAAGYVEVTVEPYKIDWLWGLMTATAVRSSPRRPRACSTSATQPPAPRAWLDSIRS